MHAISHEWSRFIYISLCVFVWDKNCIFHICSQHRFDPNFCLGSQPSWISLIFARIAFRFLAHRGTIYRLSFIIYYYFSLMLSLFFFFFSPSLSSRYGYKREFGYFNLPLYPSTPTSLGILRTTSYWKIWFCISYKTHSRSNKHGSISFMIDNMHYIIFRI